MPARKIVTTKAGREHLELIREGFRPTRHGERNTLMDDMKQMTEPELAKGHPLNAPICNEPSRTRTRDTLPIEQLNEAMRWPPQDGARI